MSRHKLLLADDSITIQKVVNLTFAEKGMEVYAYSDGDAAIENFDTVKPDIVLADVNMPGINGYQLCELLKSDAASSQVPVLLLVGSFEPFDREEAERVGASGHLTKPFTSIAELVSTVEQALASAEPEGSPAQTDSDEAVAMRPDTSDIDRLYEQSFVETVEIPVEQSAEFDADVLDDEMIQTSYAGEDIDEQAGSQFYSESDLDTDIEEIEAEALIAESLPEMDHQPESAADEADYLGSETEETEPEAETGSAEPVSYDPFASLAAEPPPVHFEEAVEPGSGTVVSYDIDDSDLLELPTPSRAGSAGPASGDKEIVSLSPELIDLIVDKVVERLAQRGFEGDIRPDPRS